MHRHESPRRAAPADSSSAPRAPSPRAPSVAVAGLPRPGAAPRRRGPRAASLGVALALFGAAAPAGGCGDGENCNSEELRASLASAGPGAVVSIGACEVRGSFEVPGGVTVRGAGASDTRVVAEGGPAFVLRSAPAGAPATRLEALAVSSADPAGGVRSDAAAVALSGVRVDVLRGVAVMLEGVTRADLAGVTFTGPVIVEVAGTLSPTAGADVTATHGLVITGGGVASLADVSALGFARFGVLVIGPMFSWARGEVRDTLGVGVMVAGGGGSIADVTVSGVWRGLRPLPAYGIVTTDGAVLDTARVTLRDNEGYGLLQNGGEGAHVDLVGQRNAEPAVWVQGADSFELSGAGSLLTENKLAALVTVMSASTTVRDATFQRSGLATRIVDLGGSVRVGDGLHALVDDVASVRLEGVSLAGNERSGLLVDFLAGTPSSAVIDRVTVEGEGSALGAVLQGPDGAVPTGTWDVGITRRGATVANDAAFSGRLDIVGAIGPMFLPRAAM